MTHDKLLKYTKTKTFVSNENQIKHEENILVLTNAYSMVFQTKTYAINYNSGKADDVAGEGYTVALTERHVRNCTESAQKEVVLAP